MPATVLFIKVNSQCCIPVRVFVNRKRVLLSSRVSINEKSTIQLSSINLIRLSNYDMTNLILDIKQELTDLLLHTLLPELFPQRSLGRNAKVSRELGSLWKCRVVVSLGYIGDLRYKLGFLQKDAGFLDEKGITVSATDSHDVALLTKEIRFSFSDHESNDKKNLRYRLHRSVVLNNRVTDSLDLFVLQRARG